MAIKLFEIGFMLKGFDHLSPVLKLVKTHIEEINEAAQKTQGLREYSENLGMLGAGALAAGGALGLAVKLVLAPAIAMQAETARVTEAMNDGAATMQHVAEMHEKVTKLAQAGVLSTVNLSEAYYVARSNMLGHTDALAAVAAANDLVTATTRNASDAQAQLAPTTRTLTTLHQLFGGSIKAQADQLATLQTKYAELDIGEVTTGLQYANPVAKGAGIIKEQMEAALAILSVGGLHGPEAGTAFREMVAKLTTDNKLQQFVARTKAGGLDLTATMGNLAGALGNLAPLDRARELKALGFNLRDVTGVNIMIDRVKDLKTTTMDLENSQGAAHRLAQIRLAGADEQWAQLQNNLEILRETMGTTLLPMLNHLLDKLTKGLIKLTNWAEAHKGIVKLGLEFMALGAAVLIPLGGLALLGASFSFIGSYVPMLGKVVNLTKLWTAAEWLLSGSMTAAAMGLKLLTGSAWGLDAAMDANPLGAVVAVLALLALAAYEIYEHWDGIAGFFTALWTTIKNIVSSAYDWMKNAGLNLMKSLGEGILAGLEWPVKAAGHIAGVILKHFKGQSPPPLGPLHQLNRIRLVETIAETMKPSPMINAIRRVAAVTAVALPMAVGSPAMANSAGSASSGGAALSYAPSVTIHVANGNAATIERVVLEALRRHRDDVVRMIEGVHERHARRMF